MQLMLQRGWEVVGSLWRELSEPCPHILGAPATSSIPFWFFWPSPGTRERLPQVLSQLFRIVALMGASGFQSCPRNLVAWPLSLPQTYLNVTLTTKGLRMTPPWACLLCTPPGQAPCLCAHAMSPAPGTGLTFPPPPPSDRWGNEARRLPSPFPQRPGPESNPFPSQAVTRGWWCGGWGGRLGVGDNRDFQDGTWGLLQPPGACLQSRPAGFGS